MQRLTRYLRHMKRFPKELITEVTSRLKVLELSPGMSLPENTPFDSWFFVEKGLIAEQRLDHDGTSVPVNFLFEGHSFIYLKQWPENKPNSIIPVAAEPTTFCCRCPDTLNGMENQGTLELLLWDIDYRRKFSAQYGIEFQKMGNRPRLIAQLIKKHPSILRIPVDQLIKYLNISDEKIKQSILTAQLYYHQSGPNILYYSHK